MSNLIKELKKYTFKEEHGIPVISICDLNHFILSSVRERLRQQLCCSMWKEENCCAWQNPCKACMALDKELGDGK